MSHLSASFSATVRVRFADLPGSFARFAAAIAEAGGSLGVIDLVRVQRSTKVGAPLFSQPIRAARGNRRGDPPGHGSRGRRFLRPDLPDAPRQDRGRSRGPGEDARRPFDGLHARGRAGDRVALDERRSVKSEVAAIRRERLEAEMRAPLILGTRRAQPQGRAVLLGAARRQNRRGAVVLLRETTGRARAPPRIRRGALLRRLMSSRERSG